MSLEKNIETDILVIGGGIAGCFAAIKAREQGLNVAIVDKAYAGKSGSSIMASGFWSVFNQEWGHDLDLCMNTANIGSDFLNDREIMGKGCIPLARIRKWMEAAGFTGYNEVEIFSNHYWQQDQDHFLEEIIEAYNNI